MKIGVSNISWSPEDTKLNTSITKFSGYDYIESAYSKLSDDFPVLAIQSIFYGSGIESLTDSRCIPYITEVIKTCKSRGIESITFGSPSMRVGDVEDMTNFLIDVDQLLDDSSVKFCIEPNAREYGGEYYNTLEEIVEEIHLYRNITSMIDIGNSMLEGQDFFKEYEQYSKYVSHIHFSAPGLVEISDFGSYKEFYQMLNKLGYSGNISYEFMKANDIGMAINDFYEKVIN
jgi:sugar phosphate isomerase/epimerase